MIEISMIWIYFSHNSQFKGSETGDHTKKFAANGSNFSEGRKLRFIYIFWAFIDYNTP